jgi:hypothetical protein
MARRPSVGVWRGGPGHDLRRYGGTVAQSGSFSGAKGDARSHRHRRGVRSQGYGAATCCATLRLTRVLEDARFPSTAPDNFESPRSATVAVQAAGVIQSVASVHGNDLLLAGVVVDHPERQISACLNLDLPIGPSVECGGFDNRVAGPVVAAEPSDRHIVRPAKERDDGSTSQQRPQNGAEQRMAIRPRITHTAPSKRPGALYGTPDGRRQLAGVA